MSQEENKKLSGGIRSTSSFCAHRLHFSPEKVVVKTTAMNYFFYSIFAALGLMAALASLLVPGDVDARWVMTAFGVVFAAIGFGGMFWKRNKLPEIDLQRRMLYPEGRKYDTSDMTDISSMQGIPLSEVERIDVSTRRVSGNKSSYTAYMLDLVFRDGYSCRLLSHGGEDAFAEDAKKLSQVLNMPVEGLDEATAPTAVTVIGGCGMTIFSIIWLSMSLTFCSFIFTAEFWAEMTPEYISKHPEQLMILMPMLFVVIGVFLLISGVKHLIHAVKKR